MAKGIDQVKDVTRKYLQLEDPFIEDVVLATVLANRLKEDPLWVFLVGPPSSAKTEILRALDGRPDIHLLSALTPQTLISGYIGLEPRKSSLIFRLTDKVLVLKDFTTVIQMRSEARQEILAQLREIYDGQYSKAFGTGEEVTWEGKLGLLAGVTHVIEKAYGVNSILGERSLLYWIRQANPQDVADHVLSNQRHVDEMRDEIRTKVHEFLAQFDDKELSHFDLPLEVKNTIGSISILIAHGRTTVERDRGSQAMTIPPLPEGPARIATQLSLLFSGLMIVYGNDPSMINRALDAVRKVGLDNIPSLRRSILVDLIANSNADRPDKGIPLSDLSRRLSMPHTTVRYVVHDLNAIRLVGTTRVKGKERHFVTPFCSELIRTAGLLDDDLQTIYKGRDHGNLQTIYE